MAKRATRSPIKIGVVLDLDEFSGGLKKARAQGQTEGNAINTALGNVADQVTRRFLSVQAAMAVAKKAYHEFVAKAQELEKNGQGNEGTAAIARISAAVDRMWTSFVRATTETTAMRTALDAAAAAAELGAVALGSWKGATDVATASIGTLKAELLDFLAQTAASTSAYSGAVRGALAGIPIIGPMLGAATSATAGLNAGTQGAIGDALSGQAEAARASVERQAADIRAQIARTSEQEATKAQKARADQYDRAGGSVVDTFVGSWEAGFARLGDLFHGFSAEVSKTLGGMAESTTKALGDTFDSVAFLGPMLQRVYGQSAEGAKRFQMAQLALAGAIAVVKAAMATAEASDLLTSDPAGAAAKIAAAAGYASAAALAGVSAYRMAGSGGGGGAGVAHGSPDSFRQERQSVTVIIQEAVGGREFVRREVIPELNRAVQADVVLLSTNAQSAGSLQPGRFGT